MFKLIIVDRIIDIDIIISLIIIGLLEDSIIQEATVNNIIIVGATVIYSFQFSDPSIHS